MKKQILVVDDTKEIHALVRTVLKDIADVHSATDPKHGLTMIASLRPDLLLLDVDMPGMDGYEFCRRAKADSNVKDVPIIFLTAKSLTNNKVQAFNLGAVDYITKPFSP